MPYQDARIGHKDFIKKWHITAHEYEPRYPPLIHRPFPKFLQSDYVSGQLNTA
jgi:hypothetical protein